LEKELGITFVDPGPSGLWVPLPAGSRLVLGRNPMAEVPLEGPAVSWEHAEIRCLPGGPVVRDLRSTNGVFVNGLQVTNALLEEGAVLRLGDFVGVVSDARRPRAGAGFASAAGVGLHVGPVLGAALAPLHAAARTRDPLVILGETGSGKNMAARLLHAESGTPGAFVGIEGGSPDATAMLFALDARGEARGPLAGPHNGTLYLANVAGLPAAAQDRLASLLDQLAGAQAPRLVVGTQEPLAAARDDGRLRPSLHDRLAADSVAVPSLRERQVEIPALWRYVLAQQAAGRPPAVAADLIERLCLYDWPCNVREMVLLARRLLALYGDEERLRAGHLPARMGPNRERTTDPVTPVPKVDVPSLLAAVREARGDIARAARRLGITRERAYRLMERLGQQTGPVGA
jgi:transcriptional regulator of acetoin/glycerol metabolism